MSLNHHILAKETTDAALKNFKSAKWSIADGIGTDFYRVATNSDFPSPDATFYDTNSKIKVSFEFKPPTETKRGMLTGVGQSIAYLQNSSLSFLIAPQKLDDYNIGDYLTDLYTKIINDNIPVGLILYENSNPSNIELKKNIRVLNNLQTYTQHDIGSSRFWAKHQDLPVPLFHLLLHYYYLKKARLIPEDSDPFAVCWKERLIPKNVLETFKPEPIKDIEGNDILTVGQTKKMLYLEKNLKKEETEVEKRKNILKDIDTEYVGDNNYNSVRKNLVTFLKHLQVIDSENRLTERGFKLYNIGLVNGPNSKIFRDYFAKELLITGHHIDLLLDYDIIKQKHAKENKKLSEIRSMMEEEYENKGYINRNPNRKVRETSSVSFLKYERIIWRHLELIDKNEIIQWKRITEVCSLPELI